MAPRETYDPEDIESLLSERSFDELLAEERAFVLRHLTGREEYEQMRDLLLRVREDETTSAAGPVEPDAAVRENVLHVFRQQQAPGWRIWLNSVQAFLFPQQASAMWRPALALVTVALLVTFGVVTYQRVGHSTAPQLAEVRKPEPPPSEEKAVPPAATPGSQALTDEEPEAPRADQAGTRRSADLSEPGTAWSPMLDLTEAAPPPVQEERRLEATATADDALTEHEVDAGTAQEQQAVGAAAEAPTVNYVEKDQLLANQSVANATGEVTMKEVAAVETVSKRSRNKQRADKAETGAIDSRSLAQDGQLLDLLNAAW